MSNTQVVPASPNADLERLTVSELGGVVDAELKSLAKAGEQVTAVFVGSLPHGIRLGRALLRVRSCVGRGEWTDFLSNHGLHPSTAQRYMRLGHHEDVVMRWISDGGNGRMHDALNVIAGSPSYDRSRNRLEVTPVIRQLRSQGLPQREIASLLGISRASVSVLADPDGRKKARARDRRRAERALAAKRAVAAAEREAAIKERDAAVKKVGGAAADAYALLRRCSIALDRAIAEAADEDDRLALNEARRARNRAEDKIVESLRLSRRAAGEAHTQHEKKG